jgi:hypothetical protein
MRTIALISYIFSFGAAFSEETKVPAAADAAALPALITKLGSNEFEQREAAQQELIAAGKTAIPTLKEARAKTADPEIKARIASVLKVLDPPLSLTVEAGAAMAGQPVVLKVRIKNTSDQNVNVVQCLDGSTSGRKRYPQFFRKIAPAKEDAEGKFCNYCNVLKSDDIVTLKPGEEFDPLSKKSFGEHLATWTPEKPGKFGITFICDYTADGEERWFGSGKPDEATRTKLALVPRFRLKATVEIEVKE